MQGRRKLEGLGRCETQGGELWSRADPLVLAAGCLFISPSLTFLACEAGMLLHLWAAEYVRCEDLTHCLPQEVLVIV